MSLASFSMKRFSSLLLSSVLLLSGGDVIGSPEVSIEEIRALYDIEERFFLEAAVLTGNLKYVKALIKAGFDVNVKENDYGLTPLHFATGKENLEITQELIKGGADVNAKDNDGKTPLYFAVERNNLESVQELIKAGANVNVKNNKDETPLQSAIYEDNNLEIIQELIRAGADVNVRDNDLGFTPLHQAAILKTAQEAIRSGEGEVFGFTSLHRAAANDLEIVQELRNRWKTHPLIREVAKLGRN